MKKRVQAYAAQTYLNNKVTENRSIMWIDGRCGIKRVAFTAFSTFSLCFVTQKQWTENNSSWLRKIWKRIFWKVIFKTLHNHIKFLNTLNKKYMSEKGQRPINIPRTLLPNLDGLIPSHKSYPDLSKFVSLF